MSKKIAFIGAGVSGLGAASLLKSDGCAVRVFEKSRGVGGRAASRSREGCRYDHGANYFTVEDPEVHDWIFQHLNPQGLIQIEGKILPFNDSGRVGVADESRGTQAKYSYSDGISSLGKKMRDQFDLEVVQSVRIESLRRDGSAWTLVGDDGKRYAEVDAVLITSPIPQAVQLIEDSEIGEELKAELLAAFQDVQYLCQYSVVLNFPGDLKLPEDAYALINSDRAHSISWISNEGFKAGHVPANESLFVVQMSSQWSARREGVDKGEIAQQVGSEVRELLGCKPPAPRWSDVQWWRYAHPQPGASIRSPEVASKAGLFFAGDAFVGKGRVAGALKSGFAVAREIIGSFHQQ